jgi:hypothetical protein
MTPEIQSILALTIVGCAAAALAIRAVRKKKSGCGGGCGCARSDVMKSRS